MLKAEGQRRDARAGQGVLKSSGGICPHRPFKKRHLLRRFRFLRLRAGWKIGNQRLNHGMAQVFRGSMADDAPKGSLPFEDARQIRAAE
jgi:hypothetical protein